MSRVAPCPRISIFRRIHALGTSTALRFMLLVHILRYPSRSASIIAISDLIMTLTLFLCFSACLCAHIAPQLSLLGSHLALSKAFTGNSTTHVTMFRSIKGRKHLAPRSFQLQLQHSSSSLVLNPTQITIYPAISKAPTLNDDIVQFPSFS